MVKRTTGGTSKKKAPSKPFRESTNSGATRKRPFGIGDGVGSEKGSTDTTNSTGPGKTSDDDK